MVLLLLVEESSHEQAVFGLIVMVKQTRRSHELARGRGFSHGCVSRAGK